MVRVEFQQNGHYYFADCYSAEIENDKVVIRVEESTNFYKSQTTNSLQYERIGFKYHIPIDEKSHVSIQPAPETSYKEYMSKYHIMNRFVIKDYQIKEDKTSITFNYKDKEGVALISRCHYDELKDAIQNNEPLIIDKLDRTTYIGSHYVVSRKY